MIEWAILLEGKLVGTLSRSAPGKCWKWKHLGKDWTMLSTMGDICYATEYVAQRLDVAVSSLDVIPDTAGNAK